MANSNNQKQGSNTGRAAKNFGQGTPATQAPTRPLCDHLNSALQNIYGPWDSDAGSNSNASGKPFNYDATQPPRASRAMRQASRARRTALDSKTRARRQQEFLTYLEPEDARNAADLGRTTTATEPETMLRIKNDSKELWKDETAMTLSTGSKVDSSRNETARLKRGPASPVRTSHLGIRPMAAVVESSPTLDLIEKANSQPKSQRRTSSATLEKVRVLRAEEIPDKPVMSANLKDSMSTPATPPKSCMRKTVSSIAEPDELEGISKLVRGLTISEDDVDRTSKDQIAEPIRHGKQTGPSSSTESVASSATSEFETVAMPLWDETERNGGNDRKKWYQFHKKEDE